MIGKLKLAIAATALLVGGSVGFALAKDAGHGRGAMKQKFDTNKDGTLDDAERAAMKEARAAKRAKREAKFDINKDGTLDNAERAAMAKDRAEARFKRLDANGDGVLSLDEFAKAEHHRHGKRH